MNSNLQLDVTDAVKELVKFCHGKQGEFAYQAFDYINATYYEGKLPTPLIQWALTPYGHCLGQTLVYKNNGVPPVITLHPGILTLAQMQPWEWERKDPWGIPWELIGPRYAYEVLLHECMHVQIDYILAPGHIKKRSETSHENKFWLGEVKRIALLLGLSDKVSLNKPTRKKNPITGKSEVKRMQAEGTLPFKSSVAGFPHGMREDLGLLDYYRDKTPPWENGNHCNK